MRRQASASKFAQAEFSTVQGLDSPMSLLHDLRSHPARGPHKGAAGLLLTAPGPTPLHCGCHPKIRQQHLAIAVYQDVSSLQLTSQTSVKR